jgi:hypothetical protein
MFQAGRAIIRCGIRWGQEDPRMASLAAIRNRLKRDADRSACTDRILNHGPANSKMGDSTAVLIRSKEDETLKNRSHFFALLKPLPDSLGTSQARMSTKLTAPKRRQKEVFFQVAVVTTRFTISDQFIVHEDSTTCCQV